MRLSDANQPEIHPGMMDKSLIVALFCDFSHSLLQLSQSGTRLFRHGPSSFSCLETAVVRYDCVCTQHHGQFR